MRVAILGVLVSALWASGAYAEQSVEQKALGGALFFLSLAYACEEVVDDPDLVAFAIEDGIKTLEAVGYPPQEASDLIRKIDELMYARSDTTPPTLCPTLIEAAKENGEAFRAELRELSGQ